MSKTRRQFNFSRFKQRHIALKILYFGWDCDGLATQVDSKNTIEYHLFQALTKTCLVESRDSCCYNRCGRTDKGVSSYGQVVNLNVRSNLIDEDEPSNIGLFTPQNFTGELSKCHGSEELNYVEILNRVLPDHIKCIAWAPVRKEFSSRFNCQSRSYSYIFPIGDLCIKSMEEALSYLVGEHDFRNICSFDLKHGVTNHKRTIVSARIEPITFGESNLSGPYSFYQIIIVGHAFLYHQIRCIMTILFLVGTKKESPDIVKYLLNVEKCLSKPHYNKASPMPLCLFDCQYNPDDIPSGWNYNQDSILHLLNQLKRLWLDYKTKSMMIENVLFDLEAQITANSGGFKIDLNRWKDFGLECDNMSDAKYIPLMKRPQDETLEMKLENIKNKRKKCDETSPS